MADGVMTQTMIQRPEFRLGLFSALHDKTLSELKETGCNR
jgi:hypothetical protein